MRRFKIGCEPLVGHEELVLEIEQADVGVLTLELTLLIAGLSDVLDIFSSSGYRIAISIQKKEEKGRLEARTRVTQPDAARMAFELSGTQAAYLQATLLRAYRDKMAAVNHVHVEGFFGERPFDMTLMFALSSAPMTPEELERLIKD